MRASICCGVCAYERPADLTPSLAARFVRLDEDPELARFIRESPRHGVAREQLRRVLRRFVTDFDADGWLGTHRMALLGPSGWAALLGAHAGGRLLDVGAGSGDVTAYARGLFREIVTTELSRPMARRLRKRGFVCHEIDLARGVLPDRGAFDAVSLLDVLDRCDKPRSLLAGALRSLEARGSVLVSVPLPARPHVDRGRYTTDPDEPLGGAGESWAAALDDLVRTTITPAHLEVVRVARAPYVSVGRTVETLDAALLVCRRA